MSTITGKLIRMKRLIEPDTRACLICALDHGMTSPKFLSGLYDMPARVQEAIAGGANVFMLGRGFANRVAQYFAPTTSLALMLTASAAGRPGGPVVTPIGSVEEALSIGADAVVVYVALAGEDERDMIMYLSQVGEACDRLGMPLIAEAEYPSAYQDAAKMATEYGPQYLKRNARLCAEMAADIIKVNWSGDQASFGDIIRACDRPVVLAGGTLISDEELLDRMEAAREVGAVGCSVGRNVFQHERPEFMMRALARIFRDKWSASEAYQELQESLSS